MLLTSFITKTGVLRSFVFVYFIFLLAPVLSCSSSNEEQEKVALKEALNVIAKKHEVSINAPDSLVDGDSITMANSRKKDAKKALMEVLPAFQLMFVNHGDTAFRIKNFDTGAKSEEGGRQQLSYLANHYHDKESWEARKKGLRQCMFEALKLDPLPEYPGNKPVRTSVRKMDGYTVQNIALETLPGLFVAGSLYRPDSIQGKIPVIMCPNGHFEGGRYREDQQYRCAMLARMGAMAISYDLFAWGESQLQFNEDRHEEDLAMTIQALNSIRILDFLLKKENADTSRVGITGGSGGGSQTMLITALDPRVDLSVPTVMTSSLFNGGCPCESGQPVHECKGGTNNAEITAMAAPRKQLVISDGGDWTANVPEITFPYLQKIYGYYGKKEHVKNAHFPDGGHDYGFSKRKAMYRFMIEHFDLNKEAGLNEQGEFDESAVTIEDEEDLLVFGPDGEQLPDRAIKDFEKLAGMFKKTGDN